VDIRQRVYRRMPAVLRLRGAPGRRMAQEMVGVPEQHSVNRPAVNQEIIDQSKFHSRHMVVRAALANVG
jgi:hypothetical protein